MRRSEPAFAVMQERDVGQGNELGPDPISRFAPGRILGHTRVAL